MKIDDLTALLKNNNSLNQIKCIIRKGNGENVCSKLHL